MNAVILALFISRPTDSTTGSTCPLTLPLCDPGVVLPGELGAPRCRHGGGREPPSAWHGGIFFFILAFFLQFSIKIILF